MTTTQPPRMPRNLETREHEQKITQSPWRPAHDLPVPDPQDGYVFRWVRTHVMGVPDHSNAMKVRREGWVPCKASDHPELDFGLGLRTENNVGNIEIGGLLLCKIPLERILERQKYYEQYTTAQMISVDTNYLRENDRRMPMFIDRKTEFGKGF